MNINSMKKKTFFNFYYFNLKKISRKFKKSEWQQLKAKRKKETDTFTKTVGVRVKRAFKKIDG